MKLKKLLNKKTTQQELLNYYKIKLIYENLPSKIYGCVKKYKNKIIIFINKNLSIQNQEKTILCCLANIELNLIKKNETNNIYLRIKNNKDETDLYIKMLLKEIKE